MYICSVHIERYGAMSKSKGNISGYTEVFLIWISLLISVIGKYSNIISYEI